MTERCMQVQGVFSLKADKYSYNIGIVFTYMHTALHWLPKFITHGIIKKLLLGTPTRVCGRNYVKDGKRFGVISTSVEPCNKVTTPDSRYHAKEGL